MAGMTAAEVEPAQWGARALGPVQTTLPGFDRSRSTALHWLLRVATAGAFIGHGAYGALMEKPGWYPFLALLGLDRATVDGHSLLQWVGGAEMALGIAALLCPVRALLLLLFVWKIGTELVWYPMTDKPAWEFVERWSNYAAPLGLLILRGWPHSLRSWLR